MPWATRFEELHADRVVSMLELETSELMYQSGFKLDVQKNGQQLKKYYSTV